MAFKVAFQAVSSLTFAWRQSKLPVLMLISKLRAVFRPPAFVEWFG